jgi:2,3-bisphosphoglycerate-independent phosphoglycerate mutase
MADDARRVLFIFLDGVGLGEADPAINALADSMPFLTRLLGASPVLANAPISSARATLVPLDATFGVPGLPQSGTGHAALFTGQDAVQMHGRHFGPWVPAQLQPIVREQSILALARNAGLDVAFANAYPEEILDLARSKANTTRRSSRTPAFLRAGPPLAALGAGVLTRHTEALMSGDAVASEIDNEGWRLRLGRTSLPVIPPAEAGRNLARIASDHALTLFAHYSTDTAGHRKDLDAARAAAQRVDMFLEGVLEHMVDDTLLIIASDHGNLEDATTGHTRNPALGLVAGEGHAAIAAELRDLTDIVPAILSVLRIEPPAQISR